MTYKVHDEHGWDWLVDKNDPSWEACKLMDRTGFKSIVLPRALLATGSLVPAGTEGQYERLAGERLAGLGLVRSGADLPAKTRNALVRNAERAVRLLECLEVLHAH